MVGIGPWKEKLYRVTYDKPGLNRRACVLKKSIDEVKRILQGKEKKPCKKPSALCRHRTSR